MKKTFYILALTIATAFSFSACNKSHINPNIPYGTIRIDIDPNSTFYQDLNTVGGWTYVNNGRPGVFISGNSRGVIIYRNGESDFMAYDRMPPNDPDKCCDAKGNCTRLVVGKYYPRVKDTCTQNSYLLLDGNLFQGTGRYPLIRYSAVYDGDLLHVYK